MILRSIRCFHFFWCREFHLNNGPLVLIVRKRENGNKQVQLVEKVTSNFTLLVCLLVTQPIANWNQIFFFVKLSNFHKIIGYFRECQPNNKKAIILKNFDWNLHSFLYTCLNLTKKKTDQSCLLMLLASVTKSKHIWQFFHY